MTKTSGPDEAKAPPPDEEERRERERIDALVDLASEQSFPASDAPSYWAGTTADDDER
jgi:hypothetical protein